MNKADAGSTIGHQATGMQDTDTGYTGATWDHLAPGLLFSRPEPFAFADGNAERSNGNLSTLKQQKQMLLTFKRKSQKASCPSMGMMWSSSDMHALTRHQKHAAMPSHCANCALM